MPRLPTRDRIDVRLPGALRDTIDALPLPSLPSDVRLPDIDLGKLGESARKGMASAAEHLPDAGDIADRLPSRADIVASTPVATEVARRLPSRSEIAAATEGTRRSAMEALARSPLANTPLGEHLPKARTGPGPLGILLRVVVGGAIAAGVAFLIANRDRVREWLAAARDAGQTRLARARGEEPGSVMAGDVSGAGTWSTGGPGETVAVETVETAVAAPLADEALTQPEATHDLDAPGWGTEGAEAATSAPRSVGADVTAMTTPSTPRDAVAGLPDALGE